MRTTTMILLMVTVAILAAVWIVGSVVAGPPAQGPQPQGNLGLQATPGTAFAYQGRLIIDGSPADDTCDFRFWLLDAPSGGSQAGNPQTKTNVNVSNGLFTVQLDFGQDVFTGDARWLQTQVRCPAGTGSYTALTPRQALMPVPYALALPGLWTQQNATSPNLIGGYSGNAVTSGVVGATISGGGDSEETNRVTDDYGTVGGGGDNQAGDNAGTTDDAPYATVGGGQGNTASGYHATVGGGYLNSASGADATVGGGLGNIASSGQATVAGGHFNTASAGWATVGGGQLNTASDALYTTVGGGVENTASGGGATVGGGSSNTASGQAATVPGGASNVAQGNYSFAAGRAAKATYQGCFVWGDSTNADVECNSANRWVARASGGVYFYTNPGLTSGVYVAPGGNSWNAISDRATKENFTAVDGRAILEKLATLPLREYNLRSQDPSIRHIGPVAQDFYAAFGYGESDRAINMEDADGWPWSPSRGSTNSRGSRLPTSRRWRWRTPPYATRLTTWRRGWRRWRQDQRGPCRPGCCRARGSSWRA